MGKFFFWSGFSLFFALGIAFLPLLFCIDFYADFKGKKFAFCLSLFGVIKAYKGYVTVCKDGILVHTSPKKAKLIPYKNLDAERKKFSFTKCFQIKKGSIFLMSGLEKLLAVYGVFLTLNRYFFYRQKREWRCAVLATDGDDFFSSVSVVCKVNLARLCKEFFVFQKEKTKNYGKQS